MTTSIAANMTSKHRKGAERLTVAVDLMHALLAQIGEEKRLVFPDPKYRDDPVLFFHEVLGVEPWSKQVEILRAIATNKRVAVKSGHKIGKSRVAAGAALWFYSSFPEARVVMSSTTARQVDQILWRETKMLKARSGRCLACKELDPNGRSIPAPCPHSAVIDGVIGELARTGLRSTDGQFREIFGFTAREAEAVAGVSGPKVLYIIDEASGVSDDIFEAIEGNRAGGSWILLLGNPTKTSGEFFDAFNTKNYFRITVSSEETPNAVSGECLIPGLAEREWIEEKRTEWGETSPLFIVRIKGEFATKEDGKIFSIHTIALAEQRWDEATSDGRLFIGLDPAGPSGTGDESVFVVRRGLKVLELLALRGLSDDAHLSYLLALITKHKSPRETAVVVMDREGPVGASVFGTLRGFASKPETKGVFDLVGLRASESAMRQPMIYGRLRDELCANLEAWIRDGGAILEDTKLEAELHELEWAEAVNGRLKVTPKDVLRKKLARSPDRYDALALAVWEPLSLRVDVSAAVASAAARPTAPRAPVLDPYAGADVWYRR